MCNLHAEIKKLGLTTAYCAFSCILPKIERIKLSVSAQSSKFTKLKKKNQQ